MRILFNDVIQYSDAPDTLKSPSLADTTTFTSLVVALDTTRTIDSVGVGNTTAGSITVNGQAVTLDPDDKNGLYHLDTPITTNSVTLTFATETTVGRVALGVGHDLGAAPAREPGFYTTAKPRTTLSGQVIPGVGGITGRVLNVDFRYKVTREMFEDLQEAFPLQIGRGYPLFVSLLKPTEQNRFPWDRLYGATDLRWIFQSSVNRFLYSKKIKFKEAF